MREYKWLLIPGLLLLSGCLFFSSPSSVVKQLMADAWNGDVDAMVKPWSRKAIEEEGLDQIRKNAERFVEIQKQAKAAGEDLVVDNVRETIQGDRACVFFVYRDRKGRDSVGMGFALIKEDGKWKIYRSIGGQEEEPFDSSFAPGKSPATAASDAPRGPTGNSVPGSSSSGAREFESNDRNKCEFGAGVGRRDEWQSRKSAAACVSTRRKSREGVGRSRRAGTG